MLWNLKHRNQIGQINILVVAFPNLKGYLHFTGNDSKGHWSTFYGNDCISDSKLRSARKNFTEMIAFPILKYNNHNTVTLCGNDCISDFQWLLCTYMIRFQFFITFCCHFQIHLSWHYQGHLYTSLTLLCIFSNVRIRVNKLQDFELYKFQLDVGQIYLHEL